MSKLTGQPGKRGAENPPSPPPVKRRHESTTTKQAVASFFTPVSKKAPERMTWRIVNQSLLVGKYTPTAAPSIEASLAVNRRKVAAFDFDSTLITTSSGNVFGKNPSDWKWWHLSVPLKLRQLYADGYLVLIVSNQGAIGLKSDSKSLKSDQKRLADFKTKVAYVLDQLALPVSIYAATTRDHYRKPRTGMWKELVEDCDLDAQGGPDLKSSIFVGDAAGRLARDVKTKADHASSDRDFAANVGIDFKTPEEFFLDESPVPFSRNLDPSLYLDIAAETVTSPDIGSQPPAAEEAPPDRTQVGFSKKNPMDIVLFCGSPAAGKSTFYWKVLNPLGYERINQDTLKTRERCLKVAAEYLSSKKSVAIDNTNADPDTRKLWIQLAEKTGIPIRCIHFTAPPKLCEHNDTVRALNGGQFNPEKRTILPHIAFTGFSKRFREPKLEEGFQDVTAVPFKFHGDEEQRKVWSMFWI